MDWEKLRERIQDLEEDLDAVLDDSRFAEVGLESVIAQAEHDICDRGLETPDRRARLLVIATVAIYVAFALALHISNAASLDDPKFDLHQLLLIKPSRSVSPWPCTPLSSASS